MRKQDRELGAIAVLGGLLMVATVLLITNAPKLIISVATYAEETPFVREVEHYEYVPYIHTTEESLQKAEESVQELVVSETTDYILYVSEEERALMERVVMSEGSILPLEGKQAIATTIVNRVRSQKFPNNVTAVVNQPYQYSQADNGTPDRECVEAVEAALKYEGFPTDMYYFRTGHYHEWAEDYCQIGNTYFSTERRK